MTLDELKLFQHVSAGVPRIAYNPLVEQEVRTTILTLSNR